MAQWYLSYEGEQIGPLDEHQARLKAGENPHGYAWREGFAQWQPISKLADLSLSPPPAAAPPVAPAAPVGTADVIDYKIFGAEMQFVEVELDPGESAVAEAGALMYKDASVQMETIFGDGSGTSAGKGFMNKLMGAGKRLLTGESLFMTVFTHTGQGKAHVAFGAPYPGNLIPVGLTEVGGQLICQKDSFICAAKGVSVGIYLQRKIMTGLFGGEGFIMQKLEGDGWVFVQMGGTVIERTLAPGEVLHVDTGCVAAFTPSVNFDLESVGGVKSMLFGGEGVFFARLTGPGKVWIQSLPFSRLAGRMMQAAMGRGQNRGEGSMLGELGDLIGGNR